MWDRVEDADKVNVVPVMVDPAYPSHTYSAHCWCKPKMNHVESIREGVEVWVHNSPAHGEYDA